MSTSAASGCVALWVSRWLIRCHIENENRTSKMPYTPYTLYGCFQLHFQKTVLLVLAAKHFTAECKISRLQSYGQPLGTQNRRTEGGLAVPSRTPTARFCCSKINACEIREDFCRRSNALHHSVIYQRMKPLYLDVVYPTVPHDLTQNDESDRVLL